MEQPLEMLKFSYFDKIKGEVEEIPALDTKFCQPVNFPPYQPPPEISPEADPVIWERWSEILTVMEKNLIWLLKLSHAKFWCQVVNNDSIHLCLDSYLRSAPRYHVMGWPEDVIDKHNAVHKLVFLSYIRMATHKESVNCFFKPEYFGELIYDEFIFDIPKILDLCSLYGNETNAALLGKAVTNIFKNQKGYSEDLHETVKTIVHKVLHGLDEKCGVDNTQDHEEETTTRRPHRLSEGVNRTTLDEVPLSELRDIATYVGDIMHTLKRFLVDVYPPGCAEFYKEKNILVYLAKFYSTTLSKLTSAVRDRVVADLHLRSQLLAHVKTAKKCLLQVVRGIATECLRKPALEAASAQEGARTTTFADAYFEVLTELLGEPKFFTDFMKKLPILDDVQSLIQASPDIDETRASFILGSLGNGRQKASRGGSYAMTNGVDPIPGQLMNWEENSQPVDDEIAEVQGAHAIFHDAELDSLISSVHDVLPHLGEGFIESCLKFYNLDREKTIHALLEGNLPDELSHINQSAPRLLNGTNNGDSNFERSDQNYAYNDEPPCLQSNILQQRKNIFDDDEFDVYQNSGVDRSRIHRGKREKNVGEDAFIKQDYKNFYEKYNIVYENEEIVGDVDEFEVSSSLTNVYDDEYDDMYDGLGVDVNDADDADDLLNRRSFVTPRVFQQGRKTKVVEDSEESDDNSDTKKPDHFIQNPADIRAKNEERRRQQQEMRDKHRGRKHPAKEKDPGIERRRKDENKARIGNHNRKKMATKKASKGMGWG